jgi:hypothetical protein
MDNKAREINSPLIKQLIDETSPEELAKIDADMDNKQQTAVEWLEIELEKLWVEKYLSPITIKPLLEQAKEMHRQQAINLYYEYERYVMMNQSDEMITESVIMTFGQFYKQTYGNDKQ